MPDSEDRDGRDDRPKGDDFPQPAGQRQLSAVQPLPADVVDTGVPTLEAPTGKERVLSTRQLAWRRFRRHKLAIGSAAVLLLLTLVVLLAPLISPYSFREQILTEALQGPSAKHWFGTDNLGRDEFTRVLYGGRISLLVGVCVALSAGVIGAVVGSIAGYYGGWIDNLLMRVTDLFLSIPFLVILIIGSKVPIVAKAGMWGVVLLLAVFFWMPDARIVRGVFLSLKEKEFVEAAKASGARDRRIIFYHILPNVMGPIIVNVTLGVAGAILTESALSFLGFGIQAPVPTWGNLLNDSQNFQLLAPWLVWFPGLMILITVLCVNFLGDGLRDALDPHQRLGSS
jgi:peptide/nickel transport system permease protein